MCKIIVEENVRTINNARLYMVKTEAFLNNDNGNKDYAYSTDEGISFY